jgi:hypothetical protein
MTEPWAWPDEPQYVPAEQRAGRSLLEVVRDVVLIMCGMVFLAFTVAVVVLAGNVVHEVRQQLPAVEQPAEVPQCGGARC